MPEKHPRSHPGRERITDMKKAWIAVVCCIALALTVSVLPVGGEQEIYDRLIRLHVLANSDSEEDQALKLTVRDAVLADCETRSEALRLLTQNRTLLQETAQRCVEEQGYSYSVSVSIGKEYYPTREYEALRLPAGVYDSVRILIGEAEGKNWWCVLFPPLCLNAAKGEAEEQLLAAGLTPGEVRILTDTEHPKYVLKFKILEFFGSLFH